jgi:hypothetical protein
VLVFGTGGVVSAATTGRVPSLATKVQDLRIGAYDRNGVRSLRVAVARRVRGGCRFLTAAGFGRATRCTNARYLEIRDQAIVTRLRPFLALGQYDLSVQTTDGSGNTTRKPALLKLRVTGR